MVDQRSSPSYLNWGLPEDLIKDLNPQLRQEVLDIPAQCHLVTVTGSDYYVFPILPFYE